MPAAPDPRGAVLVARRRQVPGHPVLPTGRRRPPLRQLRRRLPRLSPHHVFRKVTWVQGQLGRHHGAPRRRKGVSQKGPQRVLSRLNLLIDFSGRRSAVFRKVTPPPKCWRFSLDAARKAARWSVRRFVQKGTHDMLYIHARSYLFRFC